MKRLFWAFMAVSMLCTFSTGCAGPADSVLKILVGTYTEGNDSKGVYLYDFDTEKLEWKLLDTAAAGNPSFIIPSPDRHFAYAVSEYSDGRQGVYSFALNEDRIDVLNFRLFRRRSNAQERAETHQYDTLPISNFIL